MIVEPYPDKDGRRCWLSRDEQRALLDQVSDDPRHRLAVELCLDGLRSREVVAITDGDFRRLDVDREAHVMRVPDSKTTAGYRECPVSAGTRDRARNAKLMRELRQDEPLIDRHSETVQRWVRDAAAELKEQTGDDDWRWVRAHDLRRTWARDTFYALDAHYAQEMVMRWGGWDDASTFRRNYLSRPPDHLAADMMDAAGLRE